MPLVVSQVRVPSLASLYYQDNRLPDAGGDYTRISRPRMHPWTRKEKQILYILSKFYKNEAVELWGVFLAFFSDIYRRSSRPRRSAWNSMRLYNLHPARFAVWWSAATTTRLKAQVEEQALRICTPLRPVQGGDQQATAPRKRKPPHYSSSSSNSEDEWDWDTTKDTDHESRRDQMIKKDPKSIQTPRSKFITSVGGLPTPPSSQRVSRRVRPAWIVRPSIPPIAFRAFSSDSQGSNGPEGFVAGSYVQAPWSEVQAPTNEIEYLKDLERHLARKHSGLTPFISTSETFLRVIHHVLRRCREAKEGTSTDWKIAVINLSRVPSLVRPVWKLKAGVHARHSLGEWTVYGTISSSQVLSVLTIKEVFEIMSQTKAPFEMRKVQAARNTSAARTAFAPFTQRTLTNDDGIAVGRLLLRLGIPGRYIGHTCSMILWDWKFPEERDNAWASNDDFVQGLRDGYRRTTDGFVELGIGEDDGWEEQLSSSNEEYDDAPSDNGIASETPLQTDQTFMDFMADIEEAAFGERQSGQVVSDTNLEDRVGNEPQNWIRPKQESSDRLVLEAVPRSDDD